MTEPGLGSGALREALEKAMDALERIRASQRIVGVLVVQDMEGAIRSGRAALSLSSPIEPCEHDKTDLGHVHTIAEQASSEIRERVENLPRYIFTPDTDACCKQVPNGGWLVLEDVLEALAPSRQGAGGK